MLGMWMWMCVVDQRVVGEGVGVFDQNNTVDVQMIIYAPVRSGDGVDYVCGCWLIKGRCCLLLFVGHCI